MEEEKKEHTHGDSDHSHHHHHHQHHHHSKRKKTKKTKFARFLAENKRALIGVVISLVIFALLVTGLVLFQKEEEPIDGTVIATTPAPTAPIKPPVPEGMVGLALPYMPEEIPLVASWVKACVVDPNLTPVEQILEGYRDGSRLDTGLGVELRYEVTGVPEGLFVASAQIMLADNEKFENPRKIQLDSKTRSAQVYLLKADTEYHYLVQVTLSDRSVMSMRSSFRTAALPRVLSIEGAVNVRDIGGWDVFDGRQIKQGLLYRGSELDGAVEPAYRLTENGRQDMLTVLGIRTDLDLRNRNEIPNELALGGNVARKELAAPAYEGIFDEEGKLAVKNIFTELSNPDNYPVYLHCTYGLDRTGTVCFLLESVLGVSEDDLIREYELSGLNHESCNRSALESMIQGLQAYEGATLQQKTQNYLLSTGITIEQIAQLQEIFLG